MSRASALAPFEFVFAAAARERRRWWERHPEARQRLSQPVVSVGNLSVGGTGKTPLVAQIAEWLIDRGERPAILSRGYKRRSVVDGVVVVSDGSTIRADVDRAGDEPLLLARQVPQAIVCVAEDRHLAGRVAERALGATVHVLDDGFQHLKLARDLDILVTAAGEIGAGRVIPSGRLRESRDAAARADFAVFVGAAESEARTEAWELGISAFSTARRRLGDVADKPRDGTPSGDRQPLVAVAGIGRPEQFFAMLRDAGMNVQDTLAFPDHHRYSGGDCRRIEEALRRAKAGQVITTGKDAVRFSALGRLPFDLVVAPLRLELQDWESLAQALTAALVRARARS